MPKKMFQSAAADHGGGPGVSFCLNWNSLKRSEAIKRRGGGCLVVQGARARDEALVTAFGAVLDWFSVVNGNVAAAVLTGIGRVLPRNFPGFGRHVLPFDVSV